MKINIKNIKVRSICATLFISLFLSCNNSGGELKGDEVAKSTDIVPNLKEISEKIKKASDFAQSVKEIETLVKSIDELAKAIGKKVDASGINTEADKNDSLVAGVFQIIADLKTKLTAMEAQKVNVSDDLKGKIIAAKKISDDFLTKVKSQHNNLGQSAEAPKAIKKDNVDNTKGAKELADLNTAIDVLLKGANTAVESAIEELTRPTKREVTSKS
ncbi:hypothetical protein bcCo53_001554 (plasmid) [Borrelia coriaceae]|uniref:Variable outer membrane protein n=1 Tax=Borrelia coriaceae ATCC 43381 TaxID=1408429 RepID=W5SWM0_9SPIR|nr:Vsp/OspC family lipoprotein [Borrelia coriaceae]AHH11320.1 Variable outer membrane protein [Borrelia coriaceae ATCC 43381]UPA17361.1 hypothetical protein bcCo53_001554 [Borrelia coriaceae]